MTFESAVDIIQNHVPEPVREHWCTVGEVRYPAKQAYHLLSGQPRSSFTSRQALARLNTLGFTTSVYRRKSVATTATAIAAPDAGHSDLAASFATLLGFLTDHDLTAQLSGAEASLASADKDRAGAVIAEYAFSEDLLDAALAIRTHVGRLNDVIHATVIARALPLILEPGERIAVRPSLGAGNDPSRPFDLETDRRVAEFKVAQWKGADTMRKRGVFTDLVNLALDRTERRAQLFAVGLLPARFLDNSASTAEWALGRSAPHTRRKFEEAFGPADKITVADFRAGPAKHIEIIDLASLIPSLADAPALESAVL